MMASLKENNDEVYDGKLGGNNDGVYDGKLEGNNDGVYDGKTAVQWAHRHNEAMILLAAI